MKSTKTLFLAAFAVCTSLLFTQCHSDNTTSDQIPFNKDSASVHHISLYDASKLTANFKVGRSVLATQLKDASYLNKSFNIPLAEEFNRDAIAELLNQKGAKGMRIYLGQDDKGMIRLVLVATDDQHNDITGASGGGNGKVMHLVANGDGSGSNGVVLEAGQRCPTLCSVNSDLNKQ